MGTDLKEPQGRLYEILCQLDTEERSIVLYHLHNTDIAAEWLAGVLTANGYKVSATTIRTQRRAWARSAND